MTSLSNAPGGENIADGLDGELRFFPGAGLAADKSRSRASRAASSKAAAATNRKV